MKYELLRDNAILQLDLVASTNPLRNAKQVGEFLALFDAAMTLRPTTAAGAFMGSFDVRALQARLLRAASKPFVSLVLRRAQPAIEYTTMFNSESNAAYFTAKLRVVDLGSADTCNELIGLVRDLVPLLDVKFGRGHETSDRQLSDLHRPNGRLGTEGPSEIDDIYWLTVWGRDLVDRAGRAHVLSTPAHRIEELSNGAVLLVSTPTPIDLLSPEGLRAEARALAHLRPERSEDQIYAVLMERSRQLEPASKQFPADVAELFDKLVQERDGVNRRAETERLNALQVPQVTEARSEPLPGEGDIEETLDEYDDLAEQLIALLREKVPEIESFDPAVVPNVDYWMWRFKYAEDAERADVEESLVPALGAYIALVMVRSLGGTLVPRKTLDESQVVINRRVFLPFLRARHALASREAQITHSMTQLIAVARRS